MRGVVLAAVVAVVAGLALAGCGGDNISLCDGCEARTPTPTLSPTPAATPTPQPTPTL